MVTRNICVVTGGRADFGLYRGVIQELRDSGAFSVELALTGMHLAAGFSASLAEIEQSGIPIGWRIETLLGSDGGVGTAKSVGLGVIGFADAWSQRRPDLVLTLGDRFEMLAAVQAAFLLRLPIAHIGGGDVTEGAMDDAMRHAISKMSHLHFVTNAPARERLIRMGERPERVHLVGSPGIDAIRRLPLLDRAEITARTGFVFRPRNVVVTFHPVTLDSRSSVERFQDCLDALGELGEDIGILMTMPNADQEGRALTEMARDFARSHSNVALHESLGQLLYLSVIRQVDAVVGNSSSGLYEAPALKTMTVNIGSRQDGRLRASSVIDCGPDKAAIVHAIKRAFSGQPENWDSPYGCGDTAQRIRDILLECTEFAALVTKGFYDA